MRLATWRGGSTFTLDEVPDPVPGRGQVLVAVRTAGVCGTDVHATQGLIPWAPPLVMGHEYAGTIVAVGRGVPPDLVGRAVACEPNWGCGACPECRARRVSHCHRITRAGGFAERVVLPRRAAHLVPDGLDAEVAALTEPAACALAGLELFPMPRGATMLILGGGIIGLLTLALARLRGAARLVLSDPIAERRSAALRLGADRVVDPATEDVAAVVAELTAGRGADVVAEAVGSPKLVAAALGLVKPQGVLQLAGVSPKGGVLPLDLYDFHYRELRIVGAYGRGTVFGRTLALLPALGLAGLVGARFPLERVADAFAHAAAGRAIKTVLEPSPG